MARPAGSWKQGKNKTGNAPQVNLPPIVSSESKTDKFKEPISDPDTGKKRRSIDPLTERLDAIGYFHNARFPWLVETVGGKHYPMEITRFYADKKLAIDINPDDSDVIQDLKRKLCLENKVHYVVLQSPADFEALDKFLGQLVADEFHGTEEVIQ